MPILNQEKKQEKAIGFSVYSNNLNRELAPLFTRDNDTHKGTVDIFESQNEKFQIARISDHLQIQTEKGFYMSSKYAKPFMFLSEKIAQAISSNTKPLDETSKGLEITINRAEWDMRTGTKKSVRSFEELYNGLLGLSSMVVVYKVIRNGKAIALCGGHLIGEDLTLDEDKKTIKLVIPPKAVELYILEAPQRAILGESFYRIPSLNPFAAAFVSFLSMEMDARHCNSFYLDIKDMIERLSINTNLRRKDKEIMQPIQRTVSEAQKHGFQIEYVTAANGEPNEADMTTWTRFYELRLKITDKRPEKSDQN